MKRAVLATVSTVAALVLLLSFKSHSIAAAPSAERAVIRTPATSATSSSPTAGADPTSAAPTSPSASAAASPTAAASGTFTGTAADTRYGPVRVAITVSGGRVTAAQAVEYPENDPRDQEINSFAVPQLEQETVSAGNARIDTVSGATYTSDGYITSLQSALDKAGLA